MCFPILRGKNGTSSQQIVHFWAGACAADLQCCQQFHNEKTLCPLWKRLQESKIVPYGVLYTSPSCSTDYVKKAAMKKFGLTAPSSAIMVLPTDNADITKAELLSYGVFQCSLWVFDINFTCNWARICLMGCSSRNDSKEGF